LAEQKVAAAIKFDHPEDTVPQVVAAGHGALAEYIVEVAEEHGVTVYKDPPLARALGQLELGDRIPPALYRAVAEVLAFVYSLDQDNQRIEQMLQEA
jgi:flagellar biosynthesis protein